MEITLENVDVLRKRANLSYQEAKDVLEQYGGDVVKALADLEGKQQLKAEGCCLKNNSAWQKTKRVIAKCNKVKLVVSKNDKHLVNIPLTVAFIFAIISLPLTIAAIIIALLTNCKIRFENNGTGFAVNQHLEKVSNAVSKISEEIKNA